MSFYMERNGLLKNDYKIKDLRRLKEYFLDIYLFYERRKCFKFAYEGIINSSSGQYKKLPSMQPTPEIYFLNHLGKEKVYPIEECVNRYSVEELFTVIEILYEHIAEIDYFIWDIEKTNIQQEFRNTINNILKFYNEGYYLNEKGYILNLPNDAILELINENLPDGSPETVINKVNSAIKMYFHFSSTRDEKTKAICLLADVLEPLRKELENLFNKEWQVAKNTHDKLIFEIVNNYGLRHNNNIQKNEYSKDIWHDWMFHYYLSTIFTYYKLKEAIEIESWFS